MHNGAIEYKTINSGKMSRSLFDCSISICIAITFPISFVLIVISDAVIYFRRKTAGCLAFIKQWSCMIIIKSILDLLILVVVISSCQGACITETLEVTIRIILLAVSYTICCLICWCIFTKRALKTGLLKDHNHVKGGTIYHFTVFKSKGKEGVCCVKNFLYAVRRKKREMDNDVENLQDIRQGMCRIDGLEKSISGIHSDLWGSEDIGDSLKHVAQQAEDNNLDVTQLYKDNKALKTDVEILKSLVIRLDRKVTEESNEITDLRKSEQENLAINLKGEIKERRGIEIDFVRAHRNSPKPNPNGKPRAIAAKLVDRDAKDEILKAKKAQRTQNVNIPFRITPQSPQEIFEKLYEISSAYREQNINTKVVKDKLIFPDGSMYRDKLYI
ncbi:hypothetical protein KUTeg_011137 [Tegillarca granosa]|uniref:Uncharacterized protein n=1 Tax=Tegillarca granosa TaxID=220873 RepID=A0ABQ9F410_TEGGR|nr:hypothetical protein KUTeg_011137 [Tegillarca granosa]